MCASRYPRRLRSHRNVCTRQHESFITITHTPDSPLPNTTIQSHARYRQKTTIAKAQAMSGYYENCVFSSFFNLLFPATRHLQLRWRSKYATGGKGRLPHSKKQTKKGHVCAPRCARPNVANGKTQFIHNLHQKHTPATMYYKQPTKFCARRVSPNFPNA